MDYERQRPVDGLRQPGQGRAAAVLTDRMGGSP
jgi:hypothetical protein